MAEEEKLPSVGQLEAEVDAEDLEAEVISELAAEDKAAKKSKSEATEKDRAKSAQLLSAKTGDPGDIAAGTGVFTNRQKDKSAEKPKRDPSQLVLQKRTEKTMARAGLINAENELLKAQGARVTLAADNVKSRMTAMNDFVDKFTKQAVDFRALANGDIARPEVSDQALQDLKSRGALQMDQPEMGDQEASVLATVITAAAANFAQTLAAAGADTEAEQTAAAIAPSVSADILAQGSAMVLSDIARFEERKAKVDELNFKLLVKHEDNISEYQRELDNRLDTADRFYLGQKMQNKQFFNELASAADTSGLTAERSKADMAQFIDNVANQMSMTNAKLKQELSQSNASLKSQWINRKVRIQLAQLKAVSDIANRKGLTNATFRNMNRIAGGSDARVKAGMDKEDKAKYIQSGQQLRTTSVARLALIKGQDAINKFPSLASETQFTVTAGNTLRGIWGREGKTPEEKQRVVNLLGELSAMGVDFSDESRLNLPSKGGLRSFVDGLFESSTHKDTASFTTTDSRIDTIITTAPSLSDLIDKFSTNTTLVNGSLVKNSSEESEARGQVFGYHLVNLNSVSK